MGVDATTVSSATGHHEDVKVDSEIEALASHPGAKAQKSLLRKLDIILLPLYSFAYLLAYMASNPTGNSCRK